MSKTQGYAVSLYVPALRVNKLYLVRAEARAQAVGVAVEFTGYECGLNFAVMFRDDEPITFIESYPNTDDAPLVALVEKMTAQVEQLTAQVKELQKG